VLHGDVDIPDSETLAQPAFTHYLYEYGEHRIPLIARDCLLDSLHECAQTKRIRSQERKGHIFVTSLFLSRFAGMLL
jgi:hypothetical protein